MATAIGPYSQTNNYVFDPSQVAGLALWLDAADSSTVITSGANVIQWNDKSGNGRNMIENASYQRPTYVANSLNGRNSILFFRNAANSFSILENKSFNFVTASWTYFTILRRNAANTTFQRFVSMASVINGADNNNAASFNLNSTSLNNSFNMERGGGSLAGTFNTSNVCLLENIVNGSGTSIDTINANTNYLFANGSQLTSGGGLSVGTNLNIAHIRYGCTTSKSGTNDSGVESLQGNIGEVLLFNRTLRQSEMQQVESYLAWKWKLQRLLPTSHPYYNSPYVAYNQYLNINQQLFNRTTLFPNQVPGLALWLDAADSSTITQVGGAISQWRDKSGNGYNATGFSSPLYVNNVVNNLSVVRFNGTSSYFSIPGNQLDLTTEDFAIFAVVQYTPRVAQIPIIGKAVGASATLQWRLSFDPNSIFQIIVFKNSVVISSTSTYTTAGWTLFSGVVYRATSIQGFINATGLNTGGTVAGTLSDTAANVEIGRGWSGSQFFNSDMGEILLYKGTVTRQQRQQIEGYLMYKWNIKSGLPNNHPAYTPDIVPSTTLSIQSYVWQPNQYAGLALWLDSADSSTVIRSGINVSAWNDKSGNGRNFTTTSGTPTYSLTSGVNFVGSTFDIMSTSVTVPYTAGVTSIFVVVRITALNSGHAYILVFGNSTSDTSLRYNSGVFNSNDAFNNRIWYYNGTQGGTSTPASILNSTTLLNGTINFTGTTVLQLSSSFNARYLTGFVQEVLIYNSVLNGAQRQQVEGYLSWKWNLQKSLPDNHPFYNFPPG